MPGTDGVNMISVREMIRDFENCNISQDVRMAQNEPRRSKSPSFVIPSIIIDDFDSSSKESSTKDSSKPVQDTTTTPPQSSTAAPRVYTRSYSDASIKKILEEAEHRKHEFWKLLDEHNAVIENLKRIEKLERKII